MHFPARPALPDNIDPLTIAAELTTAAGREPRRVP
jgi:hypothetical protein